MLRPDQPDLSDNVTTIGYDAFNLCTNLSSVTFGHGITSIGYDAFEDCTSLATAYFNGNAPSMGNSVFASTASGFTVDYYNSSTGFTSPNWTDSSDDTYPATEIIPYLTDSDGNGGLIITLYDGPNGTAVIPTIGGLLVTGIASGAFNHSSANGVVIPNSVANIATNAFQYCFGLTQITVSAQNTAYSSLNGVLFDKNQDTLLEYPEGITGTYTVPNSVTSIGDYAFFDSGLRAITIPNTVTSIGTEAFASCIVLGSVTIPSGVTTIAPYTFSNSGLNTVTIPSSVTSIGDGAFSGCELGSVTIPDSVTTIGASAFQGCLVLNSVAIGNGVTSIGNEAFDGCQDLYQLTLGNSISHDRQ